MTRPLTMLATGATLALLCRGAYAQGPEPGGARPRDADPAAAQALFYEGRALMKAGRWAEACPKLEESLRLDQGIGTTFNLADCNEHLGKLATAWSGFLDAAAAAKAAGQAQREKVARDRARELEPKLPKLVVEVKGQAPGLVVERDGLVIGQAAFGTAIPVDPGTHRIAARAPGRTPLELTVEAREARTSRVTVPELTAEPVAASPAEAAPSPSTSAAPASTTTTTSATSPYAAAGTFPEPVEEHTSPQRVLGWVGVGVGAAGLLTAGYLGLRSLGRRNDARDHCNGDLCDARGVELRAEAIRAGNASTIATIAGGALLAGGIVLVATTPRDRGSAGRTGAPSGAGARAPAPTFVASAGLVPGGAGFAVGGTLP